MSCSNHDHISRDPTNMLERRRDGLYVPSVSKQVSLERGMFEPAGPVGTVSLKFSNYKNLFVISGSEDRVILPKQKLDGVPTEFVVVNKNEPVTKWTLIIPAGVRVNSVNGPAEMEFNTSSVHFIRDKGDSWFSVEIGFSPFGQFDSTGVRIPTGEKFFVGENNVVGDRQPAIANATDAASTQARLNDVLAALRTHGLIAT